MARCHSETDSDANRGNAAPTIDDVARRLGVESAAPIARAAFEYGGDRAVRRFGRSATVLAAVELASRRAEGPTIDGRRLADAFGADRERIAGAEEVLATTLSRPADPDETRSLRRRLVVARELLAARERGRRRPELPGSYLADAAPDLLARVDGPAGHPADLEDREDSRGDDRLRAHVERLEADLELARLGTRLYALVEDDR